ncbi:hypothetical protein HAX54_014012 [Datura stramonium]|uniref:Uncharacterized protein n=1 Tax=Datura stramonium TaxID=4076 RepID=A0ABS8TP53_DATST|nr:hypothetical protein [Datura stramonium]
MGVDCCPLGVAKCLTRSSSGITRNAWSTSYRGTAPTGPTAWLMALHIPDVVGDSRQTIDGPSFGPLLGVSGFRA